MSKKGASVKSSCGVLRFGIRLFAALITMSNTGCQSAVPTPFDTDAAADNTVLSTIAPIEILVSAIGGNRVRSECLITGELDPHSYQLVKGDKEKFRRAKIVFYSGLGLEHGPSLAASLAACPHAVSVGRWLQSSSPHSILQASGVPDPHLWMDIALWAKGLDLVCEELSRAFPDSEGDFRERAEQLRGEFQSAHEKVRDRLQAIKADKRYLMTTHDAFRYFCRAYLAEAAEWDDGAWQRRVMSPEGLAPESQISLQQMQRALKYLTEHQVSVVFAESNVNQQSLAKIVQAANARGLVVSLAEEKLYGDSMPPYVGGPKGYVAYLDMIWSNATIIARHLSPETCDASSD